MAKVGGKEEVMLLKEVVADVFFLCNKFNEIKNLYVFNLPCGFKKTHKINIFLNLSLEI